MKAKLNKVVREEHKCIQLNLLSLIDVYTI